MTQVNLILIGRAFHEAVQGIPPEIATGIARESDDKYAVANILDEHAPNDIALEMLGNMWQRSLEKDRINRYLKMCGMKTVDDFIQLQPLKSGDQAPKE